MQDHGQNLYSSNRSVFKGGPAPRLSDTGLWKSLMAASCWPEGEAGGLEDWNTVETWAEQLLHSESMQPASVSVCAERGSAERAGGQGTRRAAAR